MEKYLQPTYFLDYKFPAIQNFLEKKIAKSITPKEKIIQLFYAIRDGWRYNPYNIKTDKEGYRASFIFQKEEGHCIDKSILMISCCRAIGLPARLRLAKVKNHIAAEKIVEKFGTDELVPHAITEVFLNEKWIKITPVFNKELCTKLQVAPLDFDGENDAIFQAFDLQGGFFMEYLEDYGHFDDIPVDFMNQLMLKYYHPIFKKGMEKGGLTAADFE